VTRIQTAALLATLVLAAPARAAEDASKKDDAPWVVNAAHGPSKTVSFSTDEGTWLSLDVSPDGSRIVFSLLGDLYLIPPGGGAATRITSGPAMDLQPRFSPDGKRIAYASDRGGTENIWICDLEGKNARQVSTEKAVQVNGPEWTPDGQWLIGRKRITDQSSIGYVELWMWHMNGGDGVGITKKDDQPDAAGPAFSPDGRFLYYSARAGRYRYDSNTDNGIWQIKRLDRRNGQSVAITGESGGAAAPALSPDGKRLAFVQRIRAKTLLQVMDLDSGAVRTVAPDVTRDEQQGFCTHGLFPGYSWSPDGKSIVATAEGKIWSWNVASGARTAIPFAAQVEQIVADAVRFSHPAVSDMVRARILRWPVESTDGKILVFSAVGHLYAVDLPGGGNPRRLTAANELEYAPSFSPDGRWIVYASWSDAAEGAIRVLPAPGMGGTASVPPRTVTTGGGQYCNPVFSPDGRKLAFIRGSGASWRDHDLGDELWNELRWVDAGGGEEHYVIGTENRGSNRRMPRPQWSADGERLMYLEDETGGKPGDPPAAILSSVKLDGTDKKIPLRWKLAEEAVVSPDGRWVAYHELHDAYVTTMPAVGGETVDVSAGGPLPVRRLTETGGEWLSWSDGGKTVSWVFGPVYHRLPLDKVFDAPKTEDASAMPPLSAPAPAKKKDAKKEDDKKEDEKPKLPVSETIEITLSLQRTRPSGVTAYTGARIVTMRGDQVIENGTIVVDGDRIVAVGSAASTTVPSGAKVVSAAGKTIIPGLFDEHAHLHYSTLDVLPERPWKYLANLAYGVTSTHDPSAATQEVFAQSEMVEAGLMTGPRIFSTGYILYGANLPGKAPIDSLDDARHHLRRMKSLGAFSVKSYMQPRRDQRQWVIQAAREEKMMVVPEGGGDLPANLTHIVDGHTTVEHALPIAPLYKDVVTLFAKSGTSYTPTLLVAYGGFFGDHWFYQHEDVWKDERLLRYVPQAVVDGRARVRSVMAPDDDWHHLDIAKSAKSVLEAGGRVCLGGHGQLQGLGPHWELRAFVQGGMTPMQALRVGTLMPAETVGMDKDLGSIETGKLADFVVLEKNPLEKIENSSSVSLVVKNGRAYTPEELARVQAR